MYYEELDADAKKWYMYDQKLAVIGKKIDNPYTLFLQQGHLLGFPILSILIFSISWSTLLAHIMGTRSIAHM